MFRFSLQKLCNPSHVCQMQQSILKGHASIEAHTAALCTKRKQSFASNFSLVRSFQQGTQSTASSASRALASPATLPSDFSVANCISLKFKSVEKCDESSMSMARGIVEQLSKEHRRTILSAILVTEYGKRTGGELPMNMFFHSNDNDGDGALSRHEFERAVHEVIAWANLESGPGEKTEDEPDHSTLFKVGLAAFVPFMGFGFVDNFMMICSGEFIEYQCGLVFGISTMAAAALGNLVSDIVGLGASGGIEAGAARLGIEEPPLSHNQRIMNKVKFTRWAGSLLGVSLGCLLGMVPLLFTHSTSNIKEAHEAQVHVHELENKIKELNAALEKAGGNSAEAAAISKT